MLRVGFVIITWNSEKYIKRCLESIIGISTIEKYICVIDNASVDKTVSIVQEVFKKTDITCKLSIIRLDKNFGTTVSRNMGVRKIKNKVEYICVLDSDTVMNVKALTHMIRILNERIENGIVGPVMKNFNGIIQNSGRKIPVLTEKLLKIFPLKIFREKGEKMEIVGNIKSNPIVPVGYLMSACWLIKRELVDKIGYLDEKIFYAPEDVDYCIRSRQAGYRVLYDQQVSIIHEWQRLSRKKLISKHNFEHIKGLLYLYKKHKFLLNANKIEKMVK